MSVPPTSSLSVAELRTATALAEAILPGSRTVPGADESLVRRTEEIVREISPALVAVWKGMQRTLDAAAVAFTGKPFHALDAHAQDTLLRRWEKDPVLRSPLALVAFGYKFVHFDRRDVYETLGGKLNVVSNLEQPRWLSQVVRAEDCDDEELECEVVVIGTGAGGGVVGRELADRGFAVVFVEEGDHKRRDSFTGSSVQAHGELYRGALSVGNAMFPVFMGKLVGGSTAVNGGTSFRTPASVLDRWCETIGTDDFSPGAMSRYFDRVEDVLEIAPSPREIIGPIADVFARGCDALGWHHFAIPRNAPGCNGQGFCDFGCRTDARRSVNISYVPAALEKGAMVVTGLRADQLIVEHGRAVGISGVAKNGKRVRVRGRAVVLAGGAIPTPLFLQAQGLCNGSGQLGRNLSLHPSAGFSAEFEQDLEGAGHVPQGYGCDEFLDDRLLITGAMPDFNIAGLVYPYNGRRLMERVERVRNAATFGILVRDDSAPGVVRASVHGHALVTYNVADEDVEALHQGMIHVADMCFAAGAKAVFPVVMGADPIRTRQELDAFRRMKISAGQLFLTSYHPLGTARMGKNPRTSVVDLDHQAHELPGLFIVDGSTVPGPPGVNPQVTIMAMATRAALRIAEHLGYSTKDDELVRTRRSEAPVVHAE